MKVKEIIGVLAEIAPLDLAAPWDNPGLLLGDPCAECESVTVALDLSAAVIRQAEEAGSGLILTHHPFIFKAQQHILAGTYEGDAAIALSRAGIAAAAWHTNWDNAPQGINRVLAEAVGLTDIRPLAEPGRGDDILLLGGDFPRALSAAELCQIVAQALGLGVIKAAGLDDGKRYRRLAVCGGAGMDFWPRARELGADAMLSSDPKHHEGLQAAAAGFALLDGTHFATEVIGIRSLAHRLAEKCPQLRVLIAEEEDSWKYYSVK